MAIRSVSTGGTRVQSMSTPETVPQESVQNKSETQLQSTAGQDVFEAQGASTSLQAAMDHHASKVLTAKSNNPTDQKLELSSKESMALKLRLSSRDAVVRSSNEVDTNAVIKRQVSDPHFGKLRGSRLVAVEETDHLTEMWKPTGQEVRDALTKTPESTRELKGMLDVLSWVVDHGGINQVSPSVLESWRARLNEIRSQLDSDGFSPQLVENFKEVQSEMRQIMTWH